MSIHPSPVFPWPLLCIIGLCLAWPTAAAGTELRFARGKTSKTIAGVWRGSNDTYVFTARKNQVLRLHLGDGSRNGSHLDATLYAYCGEEFGEPIVSNATRSRVVLPCDGRYSIDISARGDSGIQQDEKAYTLIVGIR